MHSDNRNNYFLYQATGASLSYTSSPMQSFLQTVFTGFSHYLSLSTDGICYMKKQAKYLEEEVALPTADPTILRYFQRKFNLVLTLTSNDEVRIEHVPGLTPLGKGGSLAKYWCAERCQTLQDAAASGRLCTEGSNSRLTLSSHPFPCGNRLHRCPCT